MTASTTTAMEIDAVPETKALFTQVHFYIVLTDEVGVDQSDAVSCQTSWEDVTILTLRISLQNYYKKMVRAKYRDHL